MCIFFSVLKNTDLRRHLLLLIMLFWHFMMSKADGFSNPISPYAPEDFANPGIVYHDRYYYAVNTEKNCTEIVLYKSDKLENLYFSPKETIWTALAGTDRCEAIWAPCIQYIRGNWYIYYTASWGGIVKNHRMFALKSRTQDPAGPYDDCGRLFTSNTDFYAIDGKVIERPTDGSLYFVWSGASALPYQNIYIARMDSPVRIIGSAVMISGNIANWENPVHEAPAYIYKHGKSIIAYSTGQLLNPGPQGYKIGLLTNKDGNYLNPVSWVKSSGAVFQYWSDSRGTVYAPGACQFIKSPDQTEDWIIYHAKHFNDEKYNREIRAQKFTWDNQDNPLFDHPIPSGVVMAVPSGQNSSPENIVSGGVYRLTVRQSAKVLTVQTDLVSGAFVEQTSLLNTDFQKWVITCLNNGYYQISPQHSKLVLGVKDKSIDNGAPIELQTNDGLDCQQWRITDLGNGYHVVTSKHSQKCLHVESVSTNDKAPVNQSPFFGELNQEWDLLALQTSSTKTVNIGNATDLINIYPNPVDVFLNVELQKNESHNISYEIYNTDGKLFLTNDVEISGSGFQIDTSGLENGIYLLKLIQNDGTVHRRKIVKK